MEICGISIKKISILALLTVVWAIIVSILTPAIALNENLSITSDTSSVQVGVPKDVVFTVTRECGTEPDDVCTAIIPPPQVSAEGVNVHLEGVASGDGTTDSNGTVTITINATSAGTITAIASKDNYSDGSTTITSTEATEQASLNLTTDTKALFIGIPKNVSFTVNHVCGEDPNDSCSGNSSLVPNIGVEITISGAATGSGETGWDGKLTIPINATSVGNVTATARYSGYSDGIVNIPADYLPVATIKSELGNYSLGEVVVFTVTNTGPVDITPDVLQIRASSSNRWLYSFNSLGIGTLAPGQYGNISWNQKDANGNQIPADTYKARITFSYKDSSFSNSTDWFQIISCVRDIYSPIPYTSEVGKEITFRTGNLSSTLKSWNVTWYFNGTQVHDESNVTRYSTYVNNNASVGFYNVTAVAVNGCDMRRWTINWTVTDHPQSPPVSRGGGGGGSSGGGGGGGGGGGITTAEPFNNILKFERQDADLIRNNPVGFSFSGQEFSIYQVLVVGKENEGDVGLRLEHLKNASALVNRVPPGIVYANENLWINSKRIQYVDIRFRVSKSWTEGHGIDNNDIKLLRFDNGWINLDTKVINEDTDYAYFDALSPGLSSFAVTAIKNDTESISSTDNDTGGVTADKFAGNDENNQSEGVNKSPGIGIAALVGIIFLSYAFKKGGK